MVHGEPGTRVPGSGGGATYITAAGQTSQTGITGVAFRTPYHFSAQTLSGDSGCVTHGAYCYNHIS